ncbi:hypothetical protein OAB57_00270 [Bacteriovoracaceae bacterium]|nr:hypothetical protein [Bacteriovoracaceae bacterium]
MVKLVNMKYLNLIIVSIVILPFNIYSNDKLTTILENQVELIKSKYFKIVKNDEDSLFDYESEINEGSGKTVYKIKCVKSGKNYALKVLRLSYLNGLKKKGVKSEDFTKDLFEDKESEILILERVHNVKFVPPKVAFGLKGMEEFDNYSYLMPYASGKHLREILKSEDSIDDIPFDKLFSLVKNAISS